MFGKQYTVDQLESWLTSCAEWKPFPPASDRAAWEALKRDPQSRVFLESVVNIAEEMLGTPWPFIPATSQMAFVRSGNRLLCEEPFFERRYRLGCLVIAECAEHEGRFLDEIINGIWAICEESSWCLSAHLRTTDPLNLPDENSGPVALFSAETAHVLALTCYLLADELDALSPLIRKRTHRAIDRRISQTLESCYETDYSQKEIPGGWTNPCAWLQGGNNWCPWCATNSLAAAMYTMDDTKRLARLAHFLMQGVNRFINNYGEDGGCDEGPGYWVVASGMSMYFYDLLRERTAGKLNVFTNPKIAEMGRYIQRVHMDGSWFANFADAHAHAGGGGVTTYRYGQLIGDEGLKTFGVFSMNGCMPSRLSTKPEIKRRFTGSFLMNVVRKLFWVESDPTAVLPQQERDIWLPDLQVMNTRETEAANSGFVLAAKGGHNAENHNHNDIGQFILMRDGVPLIVDAGIGTYTRQTFNHERYLFWSIRGSGHNAPVINGYEQIEGGDRKAEDVSFEAGTDTTTLSMELSSIYPEEAGVQRLVRTMTLRRGDNPSVEIEDAYTLAAAGGKLEWVLFSHADTVSHETGKLILSRDGTGIVLTFDPESITAESEPFPIDDPRLQQDWGKQLMRIHLRYHAEDAAGACTLRFTKA